MYLGQATGNVNVCQFQISDFIESKLRLDCIKFDLDGPTTVSLNQS